MTDATKVENRAPRVSIGIPVYNGERYLPVAVEAFLGQSFADLELIIVDNASTDRTEEIARAFAARDPRVRYVRNESNIGAARNFCRAFELARGEYFRWASSDDLPGEGVIERCVEVLDREPSIILAYARTMIIDGDGNPTRPYDDNLDLRSPDPVVRFRQFFERVGMCNPVYGLIRSDVLRRTRLLGSFIASDNPLLAELTLYGPFWEIPERLFLRRVHADAYSSQTDTRRLVAFYFPNARSSVVLTGWRHLFENFRSVARAPLRLGEKVKLSFHLARMGVWGRTQLASELSAAARHWMRAALAGLTPQHRS